jgi:hypothetical protein
MQGSDLARRTTLTLRELRRMRRGHLRERASDTAYTLYISVMLLAIYGGGVYSKFSALAAEGGGRVDPVRTLAAAGPALVAVHLLAVLAVARDALWRGPVTLSAPTVAWLLPLPIDRGRLVRPRFRVAIGAAVLVGAAVGVVEALVLGATGGIPVPRLVGAAVGDGALLGLLAGAVSGLVVRYRAAATAVRWASPPVAAVALGLAATAYLAWNGHSIGAITTVAEWSGPWGWSAQPLVAAAGHAVPGHWAAVALLAVAGVALLLAVDRAVGAVPGVTLRARSNVMARLTGGVLAMDPRGVALSVRAARASRLRRWRLPIPRYAWLAVPWRDATALLRAPSRIAWSAAAIGVAGLLGGLAVGPAHGLAALAAVAGALLAGYLAAAQLVEPARLDADDPRRAANLPYTFDKLAQRHAIVPAAVLGVLGLAGAAVCAALTGSAAGLGLALLATPALVAGALVSAYRGPVPGVLWVGADTPVGNTAGQQVLVWYLAAPVVTVMLLIAPAADMLLGRAASDRWLRDLAWGAGAGAILLYWASRRAAKLHRS